MDRHRLLTPIVAALTTVWLAHSTANAETFTLTGDNVRIWNLAGRTTIEAAKGDQVVIAVERGGAEGAKLRVNTANVGGLPALRVLYGNHRIVYRDKSMPWGSSTNMNISEDGTWGREKGRHDWWKGDGRRVTVSSRGAGMEACSAD